MEKSYDLDLNCADSTVNEHTPRYWKPQPLLISGIYFPLRVDEIIVELKFFKTTTVSADLVV